MNKKRAAIITIALLCILIVVDRNGWLWPEQSKLDKEEGARLRALTRLTHLVEQEPELNKKLEALKEKKTEAGEFIFKGSPAMATSKAQESIRAAMTAARCSIISEKAEKPIAYGALRAIPIVLDVNIADVTALENAIQNIESSKPLLTVRSMEIRLKDVRKARELVGRIEILALAGAQ